MGVLSGGVSWLNPVMVVSSRVKGTSRVTESTTGALVAWVAMGSVLSISCASPPPPTEPNSVAAVDEHVDVAATPTRTPDDARGGRLFDNFRAEKGLKDQFEPDSSKTPELDGKGGPNGNGTLNDGAGQPLPNTGHDYRLKNLFGWDLRGTHGIYGADYLNKTFATSWNLLTDTRSPEELRTWLERGGEGIPAYGEILDGHDLDDLVAFLVKTRNHELAHPDEIFQLDAAAPKGYRLLAGADVESGHRRYQVSCADCHGADGTKHPIDDVHGVGDISRTSAYEIWFKIQHGHPGSPMLRQVNEGSGADNSRAVLEILAALCDRTKYPALAGQADVADGDVRCGEYLK
jgi:cytochrome c553